MTTPAVELWLSFNNVSKLALSIPLAECRRFAVNPLKWLRFLASAIYGQEGYLSTSKAGPEINDYTAEIEVRAYYFVSQEDPHWVDVDAFDDRTSDASNLTDGRASFQQGVVDRDGTCVITGDPAHHCAACHILPHSKGSGYILNVVNYRSGINDPDDLSGINDTRNGLLLINQLHTSFGPADSAFLRTPNFALDVDDIPYNPPQQANQGSPARRLTLQHFVGLPQLGSVLNLMTPHNSDARQPQDDSEWPPAVIVDLFYAAAAVKAWGRKGFVNCAQENSWNAYYNNSEDNESDNGAPGDGPDHASAQIGDQSTRRYPLRNRTRTTRLTGEPKERRVADFLDGIVALWMQSSKMSQPKLEGARASDTARNEDIKAWLQSTKDSEDV